MSMILKRALAILERREEKERQYGPFIDGMEKAGKIAFEILDSKRFDETDMEFISLIALKLSRESYNHKEDNILDAITYLAAWNEYQNTKSNK